jgi:ABC-type glycerol-3-phosphate transport system permease component
MRNFFMNLPGELFEAARIDGAGHFRIFFQIVIPLSKAVIAVIALFYAVGYWNVFFNAMIYLNDTSKWPIQVVLNQFVVQNSDINALQNPDRPPPPAQAVQMAVIVLATLPILIVYPFLQRYFTKGVLTGAIKS